MIAAERLLFLISSTLFLSYISGILYNRTKIPDLVWVLSFGILLGPVLSLFDVDLFINVFDLMILVTVALFSFNTGISFNIQQIIGKTTKALHMALGSFITVSLMTGFILHLILPEQFTLVTGILLGAMISGIDGTSLTSLVGGITGDSQPLLESGMFLQLEATIADPIKVVGVSTLIKMIMLTGAGPRSALRDIFFTLFVSVLIGVLAGLAWGEIITRLRDKPLNYMMTIAALFPIYIFSDYLTEGGGGPISVFLFGAVLMNYGFVTKSLKLNRRSRIDRRQIREYHDEITFLVKSMFFVYLGLVLELELNYLAISLVITLLIIIMRYLTASIVGAYHEIPKGELNYTRLFFIMGPSSLVLSQFVAEYDPQGLHFADLQLFSSIVIPVVLFSILYFSIVAPIIAARMEKPKKAESEKPSDPEKKRVRE